jgi:hypothetical protein
MAYQNNIPLANDQLSKSQGDINGNFQSILTWGDANHVDFNAGADAGKHKWVSFPEQSSSPGTTGGECALFSKVGITGVAALFFQGQSNGTITSGGFTESAPAIAGWTRLPSGILLKWGQSTLPAGSQPVIYPVASNIPVFAGTPFNWQLTILRTSASSNFSISLDGFGGTFNAAQFSVFIVNPSGNTTFNWLALGV